jgi:hypothetical protein
LQACAVYQRPLPADILGGEVFDAGIRRLSFHRGPILAQLVRGDEFEPTLAAHDDLHKVAEIDEECLYARLSVSGARARKPPAG